MKILFDENLPPRLPRRLSDLFPFCRHVQEVGLKASPDEVVWQFARENGYAALVTADADFQKRALAFGTPPKVIRIERCDFSAREITELLRREALRIADFLASPHPLIVLRRHS